MVISVSKGKESYDKSGRLQRAEGLRRTLLRDAFRLRIREVKMRALSNGVRREGSRRRIDCQRHTAAKMCSLWTKTEFFCQCLIPTVGLVGLELCCFSLCLESSVRILVFLLVGWPAVDAHRFVCAHCQSAVDDVHGDVHYFLRGFSWLPLSCTVVVFMDVLWLAACCVG